MMTVLEWWVYRELKVLIVAWLFLVVFPIQCGVHCWSKTSSGPWNSGMSDICRRSGKCGMGCDYASWMFHGVSSDGGIYWP